MLEYGTSWLLNHHIIISSLIQSLKQDVINHTRVKPMSTM